jgi:fused signal recognition particle receptor
MENQAVAATDDKNLKFWHELQTLMQDQDPSLLLGISVIVILLLSLFGVVWLVRRGKRQAPPQPSETTPPTEQAPAPQVPAAAPAKSQDIVEIQQIDQQSWLKKLRGGLSKTRDQISGNLATLFSRQAQLNDETLENLHEVLFRADCGVDTADRLVDHIRQEFANQPAPSWEHVQEALKNKMSDLVDSGEQPLNRPAKPPWVILIVGVNGVGKTTTIAKLAAHFMAQDQKVLLAAADTFRAAAIDQLQVWSDRLGCELIRHQQGSDPASVAYDGVKAAVSRQADVLLIDTAGRLHSKRELMDELGKIRRVIAKDLPEAPHETWLVIDATTGQNAFQQISAFTEVTPLTGLVVTKLDGTAKGGVVIGAADRFQLPIRYVGVGEKPADLRKFSGRDFVESLF